MFKAIGMSPRQTIAMVTCWVAGPGLVAGLVADLVAGLVAVPAGGRAAPVRAALDGRGLAPPAWSR